MNDLRFYFSLRSPYSWLAHHDLLSRYPRLAAETEWLPFWEPDEQSMRDLTDAGGHFHYTPMSRAKNLYILRDVRRLAAQRGLTVAWPIDRAPRWEIPHLAYLAAGADDAVGRAFIALAYRRRWEQGMDICDRHVVAAIATELGLASEALSSAADEPAMHAQGVRALLDLDLDGVFGVPFFVCGKEKYWGLDRLDAFAAAAGEPVVPVWPEDSGPLLSGLESHAGGCG